MNQFIKASPHVLVLASLIAASEHAHAVSISLFDTQGNPVSGYSGTSWNFDPALCEYDITDSAGIKTIFRIVPDQPVQCSLNNFQIVLDGLGYKTATYSFYAVLSVDDFSVTAWLVDLTGCVSQSTGNAPAFTSGALPVYTYTQTVYTTEPVRFDFSNYESAAMIVTSVDGDLVCDGASLPNLVFKTGFE